MKMNEFHYTNEKFNAMRDAMNVHFLDNMVDGILVRVDCDTEELWEQYLDNFPEEIKGIYRERPYHDCQACRHWFKKMGNVVSLKRDGTIVTFFEYNAPIEYASNFKKLDSFLKSKPINNLFMSSDQKIGFEHNLEQNEETGRVIRNDHFFTELPSRFVKKGVKAGQAIGKAKTNRMVLQGTLDIITEDAIETVLDLIDDGNLYRGKEWETSLKILLAIKQDFNNITDEKEQNDFLWLESLMNGDTISRMKNLSIGTLLINLSNGEDLEVAVKKYEQVVAPSNYKRPKGLFTKKMLENAIEKLIELGYGDSLHRRFASIEDISVKDTIFVNRNLSKGIKGTIDDIFNNLSKQAVTQKSHFYDTIEMSIDDFINHELPKASEVFLYTDNNLAGNFMSLIAPINENAPSMFKWNNAFSWAYRHNVADSMKQQVKAMGGDVDVDLRFSIRWNNDEYYDENDLDAHCIEPSGFVIYFHQKESFLTKGYLDVDITHPTPGVPAVENIRFKDKKKMEDGEYLFKVNQYAYRGGDGGFEAEIEFDNNIYSFSYPYKIPQGQNVKVATVTLKDGRFSMQEHLAAENNKTIWNVKMNDFVPVRLMCYSPNYWGDNNTGNKHLFFMLKDCVTDDRPNAWYNEFLNSEFNENNQVMEKLGKELQVENTEQQLSGMGFSLTKKETIIVKTIEEGNERIFKLTIS